MSVVVNVDSPQSVNVDVTNPELVKVKPSFGAVVGSGTVTQVEIDPGTTGLTVSGGPVTTDQVLTLGGVLAQANGGSGGSNFSAQVALAVGMTFAISGGFLVITHAGGTNKIRLLDP